MNQAFRNKLKADLPIQSDIPSSSGTHKLNLEYLDSFPFEANEINEVLTYIQPFKPKDYDYIKRLSIEDTLSRNLLYSSLQYFRSDACTRLKIEGECGLLHDTLFFKTLRIILAVKPKLFVLSHINYIYYTAPLMACKCLGIPILLLHGGYKETILLNEITRPTYSPACIRSEVFNQNINNIESILGDANYSRSYDSLRSISEFSGSIKSQQAIKPVSTKKRLIIINHQVISEIAHTFSASCRSELMQNRFSTLRNLLMILTSKDDIDVYLRLHPDSKRYPGEIDLVKAICEETNMPEENILLDHNEKRLCSIIFSFESFPEIINLGGNSTNELLSNGIITYSVGKCYLPESCNSYILETIDSIHHYLKYPAIYCSRIPTESQQQQCKLFLSYFRRSMIRSQVIEKQLDECDDYFHFGNTEREKIPINSFLSKSASLNLVRSMNSVKSQDRSQIIHIF